MKIFSEPNPTVKALKIFTIVVVIECALALGVLDDISWRDQAARWRETATSCGTADHPAADFGPTNDLPLRSLRHQRKSNPKKEQTP